MNDTTRRLLTFQHHTLLRQIENQERYRATLLEDLENVDQGIERLKREAREIEETWDAHAYGPIPKPPQPDGQSCAVAAADRGGTLR